MFDFTTQTVVNAVNSDFAIVVTGGNGPGLEALLPATEKALKVRRVALFPTPASAGDRKTTSVTKALGYAPVKEVAEIDLTGLVLTDLVGKVLRLSLDIKLSGSESGEYSRWAVHKGQPFYAEYFVAKAPTSLTALVTDLAKAYNKALKRYDRTLIEVTSNANKLIINATTEYQRILSGSAVELIDSAFDDMPIIVSESKVTTIGKEGFGTTWFLLKNLTLPTVEAIRFMGELQDERPLPDTIYNQYNLTLQAQRQIGSQSFVGGRGVSITNHVFYVPQGAQTAAFEALLVAAGLVLATVPS